MTRATRSIRIDPLREVALSIVGVNASISSERWRSSRNIGVISILLLQPAKSANSSSIRQ